MSEATSQEMDGMASQEMDGMASQEMDGVVGQELSEENAPMEETIRERILPVLGDFRELALDGAKVSALTICARQYVDENGAASEPEIELLAENAGDDLLASVIWSIFHHRPQVMVRLTDTIATRILEELQAQAGPEEDAVAPI